MRQMRVIISLLFIVVGTIGIFLTVDNYNETRNKHYEYIVKNEDVHTIHIHDSVAAIEVLPTSGPDMIVSWEEDTNRKNTHVTIDENGQELKINRKKQLSFILIPKFTIRQQNMTIYIPEDKNPSITIQNDVGSVLVKNLQTDGLKIQADVQKINVENVQATTIDVTSSVGSISIENSTGEISASSNVGSVDVDVKEVTGDIHMSSDVGSVKLIVDEQPDDVSFIGSSDLGSVRIFDQRASVPVVGAKYEVHLQTDVGKVEVLARY